MSATTPKDVLTFWFRDATRSPENLERRGHGLVQRRPRVRPRVRDPVHRLARGCDAGRAGELGRDAARAPRAGDSARSDAAQHPSRLPGRLRARRAGRRPLCRRHRVPDRTVPCTRSSASFCTCRSSMPRTSSFSTGRSSSSCRSWPRRTTPGGATSPRMRTTRVCITTSSNDSAGSRIATVSSGGNPPRRSCATLPTERRRSANDRHGGQCRRPGVPEPSEAL